MPEVQEMLPAPPQQRGLRRVPRRATYARAWPGGTLHVDPYEAFAVSDEAGDIYEADVYEADVYE
jgi:hypothetical protein